MTPSPKDTEPTLDGQVARATFRNFVQEQVRQAIRATFIDILEEEVSQSIGAYFVYGLDMGLILPAGQPTK